MIHTNRCKHCNKTKEEHIGPMSFCELGPSTDRFTDSGLAALDAHKEELYLAIVGYFDGTVEQIRIESILNQIEKEK